MKNEISYQTNFSGIKYSNNPLNVDPNSFSNANNVYLNKYNALISRPPVQADEQNKLAYSDTDPTPIELKLVGTYNLSNGGIIYIVLNTTTNRYNLRYRSPLNIYTNIINTNTITAYSDFKLTKYKQYYILFTIAGTKVLDINLASNSWVALSEVVDIPITTIQTGNEIVTLPGNQFTASYKKKFVLKPDSDDTIYSLPPNETATVNFIDQSNLTYELANANMYTRDRVVRKLGTPINSDSNAIVSMVGEKIAVAHADRVDISLDYGNTFQTIVYPTTAGEKYKNTASLSDDGQCFFYVHSDGVYRYMLGTEQWTLIEVVLAPTVTYNTYDSYSVERQVIGLEINPVTSIGANYCHFVNPEKFAIVLAHSIAPNTWINVFYVKGLNITNLFSGQDTNLITNNTLLSSFATVNAATYPWTATPIKSIEDITAWMGQPHINTKLIRVVDNNTVVFNYSRSSGGGQATVLLKSAPTHVYLHSSTWTEPVRLPYVISTSLTWTYIPSNILEVEMLNNVIKVLMKSNNNLRWRHILSNLAVTLITNPDPSQERYDIIFTLTFDSNTTAINVIDSTNLAYRLSANKYIVGTTLCVLIDENPTAYAFPLNITADKVIISGTNYLIYNANTGIWYTNMPSLTTFTYTYLSSTEFTQIPMANFDDQNLWLGMGKTLWIANLVDNKLSASPINNNQFSKDIMAICPISPTSKAIFFVDSITLCEEMVVSDNSIVWHYYPLKFSVGVRLRESVITTNDGKLIVFPTKYGLAVLTYQLDVATTEQAITYLTDDIKTMWSAFYQKGTIRIIHHNTQLILSNGTNQILIYDFRTNGWYPITLPDNILVKNIQSSLANYEILELQPEDSILTNLTSLYKLSKEGDELYTYATPYRDLNTLLIPWHLTSQILLLAAPNHYKNISQLMIDQVDSHELKQSAYLTTQLFRQFKNVVKPSIELIYDIDTFAKIVKKVNWWKVLGLKWQLQNDAQSSYPTQLRLYNVSIAYDISYEVK